MHGQPVIKTQ